MSAWKKSPPPKKAVLIIGSGYGALKVAEDMAQSGIPVIWVARASNFLELPGGTESFDEWPEDLNFQFRPLYLRVTRHPLVTPLNRARVESIQKTKNGYKAVIVQDPMYIDYDLCTGCSRCMEVCPLNESEKPPLSRTPDYCPSRALELDKRKLSPCRVECPLGVNVQAYLALCAAGRFEEALAVIRQDNPLPGICGRICHHPCEESCRRSELDQSLAIRDLKRFLTDHEAEKGPARLEKPARSGRSKKVAVIGSGPAGLTAAHYLNQGGFKVSVFEALPEAGGMLRAGINAFRLPRKVLDAEVRAIADSGVEIQTDTTIESIGELFGQGFKAVLIATGTHCDLELDIPGEDLAGVRHCVDFLADVNIKGSGKVGARTVVIGVGNSAMDAARTALRLGAEQVTVLAIENEDEMPAHPKEVGEAREEGVEFQLGLAPIEFKKSGKALKIIARPAHWEFDEGAPPRIVFDSEETLSLDADTIIVAIGQKPRLFQSDEDDRVETGRGDRVVVNDNLCTSRKGVFAAGDVVTGPASVIGSMASGRKAADEIINFLTGKPLALVELSLEERGVGDFVEISVDVLKQPRQEMSQRQPKARRNDFDEIGLGLTAQQAAEEAGRCLQCGACCECRICESVCAEIGAIDHFRPARRIEVISPSVIVTDVGEMPEGRFDDGEGIYRLGEIKSDLMDIMVAGSSAAASAMARATELRSAAVPGEVRINNLEETGSLGVFICTCNDTMAPPGALEKIHDLTENIPGVAHSQLIFSACHPQGSDMIANAVNKNKLSRVILASCVCCPLEFQCISCNDQRTRARIHLFDRHGLDRSRFEMLNLRDHLRAEEFSEDEIVERFRDFLRAPLVRSRYLGPLRSGTTEIGKNILLLGGSDIGLSCALNLDLQGFNVRLVHNCRLKGEKKARGKSRKFDEHDRGKSITHIGEALIEEIQGHMGNFTVVINENGKRKRWQADMVCLTDENVLPLAIHEDMTGLKKFYRYNFSFFHTPQPGLFRVLPRTLERVSPFKAGAALAAQVVKGAAEAFFKDHELSPRVDRERCRGCGRCVDICPFNAVELVADQGILTARVLRHNCVGCGGCVGRCPVTAMDMPYFSNRLLEEIVAEAIAGEL